MKVRPLILLVLSASLNVQCKARKESSLSELGMAVGTLRGVDAVNNAIRNAFIQLREPMDDAPDNYDNSLQLAKEQNASPYSGSPLGFNILFMLKIPSANLRLLLGSYEQNGPRWEFKGNEPNPFNILLWHNLLYLFSERIAATCDITNENIANQMPPDPGFQNKIILNDKAKGLINVLCDTDPNRPRTVAPKNDGASGDAAPALALAKPAGTNQAPSQAASETAEEPAKLASTPEQVNAAMKDLWNLLVGARSGQARDQVIEGFAEPVKTQQLKGNELVKRYVFAMTFSPSFLLVK